MTLHPIHTGNFKLDGGAMFGVVPKGLWEPTPHYILVERGVAD